MYSPFRAPCGMSPSCPAPSIGPPHTEQLRSQKSLYPVSRLHRTGHRKVTAEKYHWSFKSDHFGFSFVCFLKKKLFYRKKGGATRLFYFAFVTFAAHLTNLPFHISIAGSIHITEGAMLGSHAWGAMLVMNPAAAEMRDRPQRAHYAQM